MTLALDISNYSSALTPEALAAWKASGVGLVIAQSVDPPAPYPPGKTRLQIQQCLDAGLVVDAYIWLWFELGASDIRNKLALLDGLPIRRLWLDVEDEAAKYFDQVVCEAKVGAALDVCDTYLPSQQGRTGVYTGRWFWVPSAYMNDTTVFADRDLWDANYDEFADAARGFVPYGGWSSCAVKQYQGTTTYLGVSGVDLDVLSNTEAAKLTVTDEERAQLQSTIDGLVNMLGLLLGDDLKPLTRATAPKYVKTFVAQARGIAEQAGVNHA